MSDPRLDPEGEFVSLTYYKDIFIRAIETNLNKVSRLDNSILLMFIS